MLIGFHEKIVNSPGNLANGAVYILSTELLDRLGTYLQTVKDFITAVLNRFVGHIYNYKTSELFLDLGTLETYARVNKGGLH